MTNERKLGDRSCDTSLNFVSNINCFQHAVPAPKLALHQSVLNFIQTLKKE